MTSHPARAAVCAIGSACLLVLAGCTTPLLERDPASSRVSANRPDGEAYAGKGEIVLRLSMSAGDANLLQQVHTDLGKVKPEMAHTELRYEGLDSSGNAVFSRRDVDLLAKAAAPSSDAKARGEVHENIEDSRNVEEIVVNLRVKRQIHIQGRTIEILDAHPEGVVFRLYTDN